MNQHHIIYNDDTDFKCLILGRFGFSSRGIGQRTSLSASQVNYRLKQLGIKRKAYRDGDSPEARKVISMVSPAIEAEMRRDVAAYFRQRKLEAARRKQEAAKKKKQEMAAA